MVVVDWNTDITKFLPLKKAFKWHKLKSHHIVVDEKSHNSIDPDNPKRVIYDYAGRNRGFDFAVNSDKNGFCVLVSQDIYIRKEVFELVVEEYKKGITDYFTEQIDRYQGNKPEQNQ